MKVPVIYWQSEVLKEQIPHQKEKKSNIVSSRLSIFCWLFEVFPKLLIESYGTLNLKKYVYIFEWLREIFKLRTFHQLFKGSVGGVLQGLIFVTIQYALMIQWHSKLHDMLDSKFIMIIQSTKKLNTPLLRIYPTKLVLKYCLSDYRVLQIFCWDIQTVIHSCSKILMFTLLWNC